MSQLAQQQNPLQEADRVFLEKLQTIDWGPIAFKLMNCEEGESWTLPQVTSAIEQYRKFLFPLSSLPRKTNCPQQRN